MNHRMNVPLNEHRIEGAEMKAQTSAKKETAAKQPIPKMVSVTPIPLSELFPPIDYEPVKRAALGMIPELAAHAGSPALHLAIRTSTRSRNFTSSSVRAGWGEFWDRGRGIAFVRRASLRTRSPIEFGYFGDKQKLAIFSDLAERVWRTTAPLSWQRLLPLGNSNGSNSARDNFALSLFSQPARFMDELPLNWRGEGAYAKLVEDMNLGKLLDVIGCESDSPEREAATIERILEDFLSRPDYLYLAISGDVFHAAVECLQQLAVFWGHVERGTYSEQSLPRNDLETLDIKYLQSDDAKRDRMAYLLLKAPRQSHSQIREIINRTIHEQDLTMTTTLDSSQALTYAAKRWAEKSPEPLPPPDKRMPGCRRSRKRKPE